MYKRQKHPLLYLRVLVWKSFKRVELQYQNQCEALFSANDHCAKNSEGSVY